MTHERPSVFMIYMKMHNALFYTLQGKIIQLNLTFLPYRDKKAPYYTFKCSIDYFYIEKWTFKKRVPYQAKRD